MYSAVHQFCITKKAEHSWQGRNHLGGMSNCLSARPRLTPPATLLGGEIYDRLSDYLSRHLKAVQTELIKHNDEQLLATYIQNWERYTIAARFNHSLFDYLNRHWVPRERDEGKKDVHEIYTMHLVRWRDTLFKEMHTSIMDVVLSQVEKMRLGETIEHGHIKSVCTSFESLGIDEHDPSKTNLDTYRQHFEKPYLVATADFYRRESAAFLAENSVIEYMKKAEKRLEEEKERVALFLLPVISLPLMKACEKTLIQDHCVTLKDEFQTLLNDGRVQDMARMYKLLHRIPEGLEPLRSMFEQHVLTAGNAAVERLATSAEIDPRTYIEALLEIHTVYFDLVGTAFGGDSEFVRSLDNACRNFVNRNALTKTNATRTPELLSKHTDALLKRSTKGSEEDDIEKQLNRVMTIFRYVEDKDVFNKFYSQSLAKRLVHGTSISPDAETSIISKLKDASGFEYTNKLQRMFQDMQTSKDLNDAFKTYQSQNLDNGNGTSIDAYYNVLGTGFWPLRPTATTFVPPPELVRTYTRFVNFYSSKHSGRKLTWLWHLSKGEIRANHIKMNKVPYTFAVSTYQMAILLMYNDKDVVTYDQMTETTSCNKETLDPSIAIMVKAKVILPEPDGAPPQSGTSYRLNYGFKNKKLKVSLNIAIKSEQKQDVAETHKTIEEDRKMLIQVSGVLQYLYFVTKDNTDRSLVCDCSNHEITQDNEAQPARQRSDFADQEPLCAQGA